MDGMSEASASSLEALSEQYRIIAHNLANVSTAGYKRRMTQFVQVLNETMAGQGSGEIPDPGTVEGEMLVDYTQGSLVQTDNPLDVALDGKGFFIVESPEGQLYTRSGTFRANAQGQLVDLSGRTVLGEGGPIILPSGSSTSDLRIARDGSVSAGGAQIGKLKLVEFEDTQQLIPAGDNCFSAVDATPVPAESTSVYQRFKEASNVNMVQELVGLITVTRMYEANIKMIQTLDEQMEQLLNVAMS